MHYDLTYPKELDSALVYNANKTVVTQVGDQTSARTFTNTTLEVAPLERERGLSRGPQRAVVVVDFIPHKDWKPPSCLLLL